MTKVRQVKRKKRYLYNVNRKRMNKKKLPALESETVKQVWNRNMSFEKNFKKMGLVFDVNRDIKNLNKEGVKTVTSRTAELPSTSIIEDLQKDSKLAKASVQKNYKFSKDEIDFLVHLMEKYGDDYKAMSRDRKNYLQLTWKQIRHKINSFKRIHLQGDE